jgi:hypothetical protein
MKALALITTMLIAGPSMALAQPMVAPTALSTTPTTIQGQEAVDDTFARELQQSATLSSRELNALRIGADREEDVED